MNLDNKLKKAVFLTAVHCTLRNKTKDPKRTARNLIEAGLLLTPNALTEKEQSDLISNLSSLLVTMDSEETIQRWLLTIFPFDESL